MGKSDARLVVALFVSLAPTVLMAQDGVEWLVAPYGWLPDISLRETGGGEGDGGDGGSGISGADLLDKTDAVGMIRVEAARNRWGVLLDYIFLDLSDSSVIEAPGPVIPDIAVRAELDLTVLEVGAVYRPSGGEDGLHYLFGYRGIDSEKTLLVTPEGSVTQRRGGDAGLSDVFLGARYVHRFNEYWDFTVRGDYGFGESDGVLNVLASVGVRFPGPFALQAGYRYADLEYTEREAGERITTEIGLSGAFIGLVFRF
jgi:hypothetical protein